MFNYETFLNEIWKSFDNQYTEAYIRKILDLPEPYDRDTYESIGKRLIINRLKFTGIKNTRERIDFDEQFDSGVNVFIASNGKGKSSVFKIMKFLITGDKSLKKDVQDWLEHMYLEFTLGTVSFTAHIDRSRPRLKGALYKIRLNELLEAESHDKLIDDVLKVFQVNSEEGYQTEIEEFFFDQFKYYNLFWMSSNKSKIDLVKNQTSWKTYYKSIYLESKDYNVLFLNNDFGAQGKKILEMILGLKLTYPINALHMKRENYKNEIKKQIYVNSLEGMNGDEEQIQSQIEQINFDIDALKKARKENFSKSLDINQYQICTMQLFNTSEQLSNLFSEKAEIEKEIVRLEKYTLNLQEDLEFGLYFSNLSIKKCPRCEKQINEDKRHNEAVSHNCMVCDGEMDSINESEKEDYEIKISEMKSSLQSLLDKQINLQEQINRTHELETSLNEKVKIFENRIQKYDFSDEVYIDSLQSLVEARTELQLALDKKVNGLSGENPDDNVLILDKAIEVLSRLRNELNRTILIKFSTMIKEEVKIFGVKNIEDVYFDHNLELVFVQNQKHNKFSDLNEGEQLRVKISFYMSLILLDIEFKVGRHPRLIMIDSPGKEEVIASDLLALASTISKINKDYSSDLQIFIGSSLYEFSDATSPGKRIVKDYEKPVF